MPAVSIVLPAIMALRSPRLALLAEYGASSLLAAALARQCFLGGDGRLIFLLLPVMVLTLIRLGLGGAAMMLAVVVPQALLAEAEGRGALAHFPEHAATLAWFIAGCFALTVPVALLIRHRLLQLDARAQFLASMSHDIRTPMTGVLGFADLLRQGELTAEQRRNVDHIAESGQTMVRLLNDILDFSRLEAGRPELAREEVDLHAELHYAAALFQPRAREKGLRLTCEIEPHVPQVIRGDVLRLRQVLLNLVGNAVKFTDHGHVRISAHAHRGIMASELVVEVSDNGPGIAPAMQGRIFEKYAELGRGAASARGGTGLGLAIARQLVELMDGRIELASQPSEGSTFTIRIPVQVVAHGGGQAVQQPFIAAKSAVA